MPLRAGFIGLGSLGRPMARRLLSSGLETTVCDVAETGVRELVAAGAAAADSPADLARRSDVIGVCVPEDAQVWAVVTGPAGILEGAAPGTVVLVHSTVLPATVLEVAEQAAPHGVGVLDACVTGGPARAAQGELTLLVGGDAPHLERARPVLEIFGRHLLHAGALGSGCKLKLCINVITYLQWAAAHEASLLAKAVGLAPELLERAGEANGQITPLMLQYLALQKAPPEVRRSEEMQRTLRGFMALGEKDLAWALRLAREAGVSLPAAGLVSQLMARLYGVEDAGRR